MDESERNEPYNNAPSNYNSMMARAIASAGIFGLLGGWLGQWLGKRGNAPKHGMAQSIMKWGMGIFSAILAAYSSLKASEHERAAQPSVPQQKRSTQDDYDVAETKLIPNASPLTQVSAAEIAPEKVAKMERQKII